MIKVIITLCLAIFSSHGLCGVTVLGTRFEMSSEAKLLNIKVSNDNESDYIIKSTTNDDNIIITPPIFLLKKDSSNLITLIPKEMVKNTEDKIVNLTITAIPKSLVKEGANSVSMAVRSHFKVILRHKEMDESSFKKLTIMSDDRSCMLVNNSKFVFTVSVSDKKNGKGSSIFNIKPSESRRLGGKNTSVCDSWINFHNEYNDIVKSVTPPRIR